MTETIAAEAQAERRSPQERKALGKEARRRTPLDDHAQFDPPAGWRHA